MKIFSGNYLNPKLQTNNNRNYGSKHKNQFRHDNVCFKAADLLDLPEYEIIAQVKNSINNENFIGQGTEAKVYRIKNSNYCVRIPHGKENIQKLNCIKKLTMADKINHIKAKLGQGITIIEYFEGVTPNEYSQNDYYRKISQEKIAKFPQKSYTELLNQIACALKNKMFFDFSGGNLIVNFDKQKLTAIDFYTLKNDYSKILMLLRIYSALTWLGAEEKTGKKLFDNIIESSLEEFKPNQIPCIDVEYFDFVDLIKKRISDLRLKECGCEKETNKSSKLITTIFQTVNSLKNLKKEELADKTLAAPLLEKINELKNLLKKVH